jgi:hypothetical protein
MDTNTELHLNPCGHRVDEIRGWSDTNFSFSPHFALSFNNARPVNSEMGNRSLFSYHKRKEARAQVNARPLFSCCVRSVINRATAEGRHRQDTVQLTSVHCRSVSVCISRLADSGEQSIQLI